MATVTPQEAREAVASIFLSYMGRAPEYEAMAYYANLYNELLAEQEDSDVGVANAFKALSTDIYLSATINGELPTIGGAFTAQDYVNWIYNNVLGREADEEGLAYWTAQLESGGIQAPELVAIVLEAAQGDDRDAAYLNNRTTVAVEYAKWENSNPAKFAENPELSASIMDGVNEDPATVDAALLELAGGDGSTDTTLTVGVDNLIGTDGDDVFTGPLAQNALGAVTNTFESGDSIDGQGGYDILNVDLTTVVSGTIPVGPAISSTTNNVEEIHLRAQFSNLDVLGNFTTIDAEHNHGVEQWWSDNSRSTIVIEDIRSRPQDTAFGMRQTDTALGADPLFGGPDFIALFDPAQLSGSIDLSDSSLTLTLVNNDDPASELADFPVTGVVFNLNGEQHVVASEDMGAAATYAEFVDALNAALADEEGVDGVTAVLNGDNTITLTDPEGGTFVGVGYTWVDGIVPADGNLAWSQVVGAPVEEDIPITTTLYVDDVGRSDMGGAFIVGSMGTGGVEQFDLLVQRSSWVNWLSSTNNTLEIVNVAHDEGYDGDLTIGWHSRSNDTDEYNIWTTTDDRVWDGMEDVRVFDASGFTGALKVGAELTFDSIDKYLADATEPVQFSYLLGDGGSNLTLWVSNALSADPDFMLEVVGGLGDDRLNLGGAATKTGISVDGGEGYNTIELTTSTGDNPDSVFADFENIQKAVIAGNSNTVQDFVAGNMLGLEEVVIATDGGADTTLRNLDESLDSITVSGKNQTLGSGNNNDDQFFGTITLTDAAAEELNVILDNTARLDGTLGVDGLVIDGAASAVRTLNVVSDGERDTVNEVDGLDADRVTQLNLLGSQDLAILVNSMGKSATNAPLAFEIDGSELGGDLLLGVVATDINNSNAAGHNVTITGTAGDEDVLGLGDVPLAITENTTISGFETVILDDTSGSFNTTNVSGVELYVLDDLLASIDVFNLRDTETFLVTDGADQDIHLAAAARSADSQITVGFDPEFMGSEYSSTLSIENYRTITLDFESDATTAFNTNFTLLLPGYETPGPTENVNWARTLEITGGAHGPAFANVDTLELQDISASLTTIDLSGFQGHFEGSLGNVLESDGVTPWATTDVYTNTTVVVNGYGFDFDITNANVADTITTFKFTTDALHDSFDWTIEGFNALGAPVVPPVTVSNVSVLDFRDLGIQGLADLNISDDGTDTTILSNDAAHNFEIILTGVLAVELNNENFLFAA